MPMSILAHKRVLVGITGGIAAYKSAELVRQLKCCGAEVQVVMTENACRFVTPLTMQALSGRPVHTQLFDDAMRDDGMTHIELARWCDVVLVAPASANFIGGLANGLADSLLSTLCLAITAPLLIAPAMNQQMWAHAAMQENIKTLSKRMVKIIGPDTGQQACGEFGAGRMVEIAPLITAIQQVFSHGLLADLNVMVSAGATREVIDPVRYITNHSSGRMGYEIANSAVEAGAKVTLISGTTTIQPPQQLNYISVNTAEQMFKAIMGNIMGTDIFISAAAVADYRCAHVATQKIKKQTEQVWLLLQKNPDILAEVAQLDNAPFTVGFAAETENLLANAKLKFKAKNLDMIAANLVGENIGFNDTENALEVFWESYDKTLQHQSLQCAPKDKLARQLIQLVVNHYYEKNSNQMH